MFYIFKKVGEVKYMSIQNDSLNSTSDYFTKMK